MNEKKLLRLKYSTDSPIVLNQLKTKVICYPLIGMIFISDGSLANHGCMSEYYFVNTEKLSTNLPST